MREAILEDLETLSELCGAIAPELAEAPGMPRRISHQLLYLRVGVIILVSALIDSTYVNERCIMSQETLTRQFINDAQGRPIAVILPIEEYAFIKAILEEHDQQEAHKIQEIELAANDPLFLADLEETMAAFEATDADWWERKQ
mgnify:CR=1 FL=1